MKQKGFIAILLLMAGCLQTALAQKVVLHPTGKDPIEYEVTELDSIVFVDEGQEQAIMDNAANVQNDIMTFFDNSETVRDMASYLNEIKTMENVEDAWQNDISISVKIKNGGIITWCFFPKNGTGRNFAPNVRKSSPVKSSQSTGFALCEKKNSCIVNTIPYDQVRNRNSYLENIAVQLEEKGYGITKNIEGDSVTASFLCEELPNYGVCILFTHGDYIGGQHWIMTGTTYDKKTIHEFNKQQAYADIWPELKFFLKDWQSNKVQLWVLDEVRNNKREIITYLAISETYIKEKMSKSFPTNSFMYAVACSTLKDNPSLWNVFKEKGLGCYFGYDNYVHPSFGIAGLNDMIDTMLYDYSTASEGYEKIPEVVKSDDWVDVNTGNVVATVNLKYYPEGSNVCLMSICPDNNHPHAIDLGLPSGTKWACCNVGANSPEEYGGYYAWGETSEKSEYSLGNYKYYKKTDDDSGYTKYCSDSYIGYNGFTDGKTKLNLSDDVAHVRMGSPWRMPSVEQMEELKQCSLQNLKHNDKKGFLITGSNGRCIFIPAAGFIRDSSFISDAGHYWSCSRAEGESYYSQYGYVLGFNSSLYLYYGPRCEGRSVRAVSP